MARPKRNAWACSHTDRPNLCHGLCKTCASRDYYRQANPNYQPRDQGSRLASFIRRVVAMPNGCWLWTGAKKSAAQGGYPMMHPGGKHVSPVHAVAFAFKAIRGIDPPKRGDGVELSHTCETGGRCCNPYHVEIETRKQNLARIPREVQLRLASTARAAKGPIMVALCHPERKHRAHNLCGECYAASPKYREVANKRIHEKYADPVYKAHRQEIARASYHRCRQRKLKEKSCQKITSNSPPVSDGCGPVKVTSRTKKSIEG